MDRRPSRFAVRAICRAILLAGCLAIAGCGGEATAPAIRELVIDPVAGVHAGGTIVLRLRYSDEDGDLSAGYAELTIGATRGQPANVFQQALTGDGEDAGTLELSVTLPGTVAAGDYQLQVVLVDGAGHRSNALAGTISVS